ncbi:MAG: DUF2868 domain-containing protein [Gammaproteobacteria bacterium]|jgi:hypothetical protein
MTHASLLSDLIDLDAALKSDTVLDLEARKQRDRGIGQTLGRSVSRPARQLRGWLDRVRINGWQRGGGLVTARLYLLLCMGLVVAGLAAGWGFAGAVLHYTGDTPINIVNAVGLLVVPQILLLLLWVVAATPCRVALLDSVRSLLRFLNPARLVQSVVERFPRRGGHGLEVIWNSENALVMAPVARWLLSFWSQLFAVCFNLGVLAALFYLISFSDLAFAWSTTLAADDATFHGLLVALSWPWHSLFPDAVPGMELVEISRYYRLDEGALAGAEVVSPQFAARLGAWWPFLVAAVVCYGLVPRLLTLALSWVRLRHHLGRALPRLPGAAELLARMNSPLISTAARGPERTSEAVDTDAVDAYQAAGVRCSVIEWSGSMGGHTGRDLFEQRLRDLGIEALDFHPAGGSRSLREDGEIIAGLCREKSTGVAVIVKSWEPPLLDLLDFLRGVRGKCSRQQPVIVLLWGADADVSERDREAWSVTLRKLGDPDLHVESIGSAS